MKRVIEIAIALCIALSLGTAFAQANYSNSQVTTRAGYPPAITVWQAAVPNDGLRPLPAGLQQLLDAKSYEKVVADAAH